MRFRSSGCLVGILILSLAAGCITEEEIKKANGYYQEGLANLETDRQKAFVAFQRSVLINPRHKEAHYYLGHLYAIQGKFKEAEKEFVKVLRIDPQYSEAQNYLGQVLEREGRWQEAIEAYNQALSNPLYATPDLAWFNLGRALMHQGQIDAAVRAFEDALRISPPSLPAGLVHLELGRAYQQLGQHSKARQALKQATTLDRGGEYAAAADKLLEQLKP